MVLMLSSQCASMGSALWTWTVVATLLGSTYCICDSLCGDRTRSIGLGLYRPVDTRGWLRWCFCLRRDGEGDSEMGFTTIFSGPCLGINEPDSGTSIMSVCVYTVDVGQKCKILRFVSCRFYSLVASVEPVLQLALTYHWRLCSARGSWPRIQKHPHCHLVSRLLRTTSFKGH
jgi:hypothetical protein